MAANIHQKIVLIDINANTQALIEAKLLEGYVIISMVSLLPTFTKLLIIYVIPVIPPPQP
jgi:hypothetical protein